MRQEDVFEMVSGLVDNELSAEQRYQILNHLEQDKQSQDDYHKLKNLKTCLSTTLPQDKPSDNFEALLKERIADECSNKPSWFENLVNSWDFNWGSKLGYGLVTASILFIGFIGVKYMGTGNLDSSYLATHSASSPHSASPISLNQNQAITTTAIIDKNGSLKVYNQDGKYISIPLNTDNPLNHIDPGSSKDFNEVLTHVDYYKGIYYREIGDHKKSKECLSNYLKENPESSSKINNLISGTPNGILEANRVSPGSNEK